MLLMNPHVKNMHMIDVAYNIAIIKHIPNTAIITMAK